eukprot:CAMPEP_0198201674 /NCGR_PEP_ID=MMETSP1445-20131203/4632_1 /TAXON_ID=36898 /ORGANISM="Pyramimonas sp., Strain CCMP2087" /LENGTH=311 /DNA_ID=CAMNT_0043872195 /DNA_START=388 /DNA_END=1323 /DNA_ORIENTATION=+
MYATSILDLQRGLSGIGSGSMMLGSMQMEELMKEINVRAAQNAPPAPAPVGFQPFPARGSTVAPASQATAVSELTVPNDMKGKTVEQVWALIRQQNAANEQNAAGGLRNAQSGSLANGELRELSLGTFLDTVGIDGAKSLQNVYFPTGQDLAQMAQETLAGQKTADEKYDKGPSSAGTGGGSSDGGNESRGNGDGEPAATAQSNAAKDAARAARQARMQRKRKEPEPIQEQVSRLQKRKVKNRESAARSRNRKQQYCDDLEQEVAKLSAENRALRLKLGVDLDEDMKIEVPKNSSEFPMKNRLRRTKTAPA